jgi:hypothetical protein
MPPKRTDNPSILSSGVPLALLAAIGRTSLIGIVYRHSVSIDLPNPRKVDNNKSTFIVVARRAMLSRSATAAGSTCIDRVCSTSFIPMLLLKSPIGLFGLLTNRCREAELAVKGLF